MQRKQNQKLNGKNSRKRSEFPFYERVTTQITNNAAGTVSTSVAVSTSLILAARLAGLQAIYDEGRINRVKVSLRPSFGRNVFGRTTLYIERDTADAIAATAEIANNNFESVNKHPSSNFELTWLPQEPQDREFQSLGAFTSLAFFGIVSSGLTYGDAAITPIVINSEAYDMIVESWWTLRGRP